ncbi:MAG: AVAST type 4 anti-phage nuclease Avs4 [Candidatus Paceibacterota bacterium]|jgi:hypothetical protein
MIKPSWDIFRAKFSENPQNNFEWFCYSLFCREFNKTTGIFRYKNQSATETDPIQEKEEVIGWQAKFYSTSLSNHSTELINILEKTKRDYANITKLILYTNEEWGQNKGKEPQGKKDIESKANTLNIKLEWRTASFFESNFVAVDNEIIAKHFFSLDKSIFDLIKNQQDHSENILNEIQTAIIFNGQNIKIDRSGDLEKIKVSTEKVLILSGVGGVGKTATIKDFYEETKGKMPFYIFKATEFELRNISEFFTGYSFQNFLDGHKNDGDKIIVIDSAEKLLDLKNTDPFKEFLSIAVKENWKVIFTTRDNYLEDLNYQFFEIYKIAPLNINLQNLEAKELSKLSEIYHFSLPNDEKLVDLIKNPFYLNEYLKYYKEGEQINYTDFKDKLWNKIIIKSKPAREQCFLRIALQRATDGQFFINTDCESGIIDNELKKDGILGYESPHGYFITHDIYEEWALEKNIEIEFGKKTDNKTFFQNLGSSLPLRRAFRKWVSEKLLLQNSEIKSLIEQTIKDKDIKSFWKDEILVSVLLSNFSSVFFELFKNELLSVPEKVVKYDNSSKVVQSLTINYKYEESLLHRIFFLLRIACKEVDDDFFKQLGVQNLNIFSLKYILTRPKGQGWKSLIKFVYYNFDQVGIQNIHFILPIIHDWTSKFKEGETTRYSGLMALKYYQWTIKKDVYISDDDTKNNLLQTIIYSSTEIKNELEEIFKEVVKNKWKNHRDPYHDLSEIILTKFEGATIAKILPKYVLQIADLFWSFTPPKDHFHTRSGMGVEEYFDMEDDHLDYFPASSYQTPIYWLLQSSLQETIDFILKFTNKTVEYFAKSEFAKYEVEEVEVIIEKDKSIKQYISCRLWCTFRGTQTSPHVLESIHMALEKFFLENGKIADSETLESWLLYLLRNSKSASISGVIASIVLAYPEKTFNIAKILFRTKSFFLYDTSRLVLDQGHKGMLLSLKAFGGNSKNEFHESERLQTCDDKHRKLSLENLFLNYQLFRNEGVNEEESKNRQQVLWEILDDYYKKLPNPSAETGQDKTWRLYLARMDRRKMNLVSEKTDDGYLINFNPQIDPELKEYSEKSLEKNSESSKYLQLKLWANFRFVNDEKYKQYKQYEDNPSLALKEAEEILAKLKASKKPESFKLQHSEEEGFYLLNNSIPVEVCSVMIRDFFEKLSKEEAEFCNRIVLEVVSLSSGPNYQYQAIDGAQSAIPVLPLLFEKFPKEKTKIKEILLFNLFNYYPIDMAGTSFNAYSITAIHKLWGTNFGDIQSVLLGYLLLKPKFDGLREKIRQEKYKKSQYDIKDGDVMKKFLKENKAYLEKIRNNQLLISDVGNIEQVDLHTLKTAFQLVPLKTKNEEHKIIVKKIISAFANKLISSDREDMVDYGVRHGFLEKLAYFVLSSPKEEVREYLKPFLDKFNSSEAIANLFEEFISAEDYLNSYEVFWEVWRMFKEKIVEVCKKGDGYWYVDKIIKSYLFAQNPWKESATEWHTFKNDDKIFFKEISESIGQCASTLYVISKLLNDIGSNYMDDGVLWVSDMLVKNQNLLTAKLEVNTLFYIENLIRKYIYKNRTKIRETKKLKDEVLVILDFLIVKGSVVGYILRENII